MHTLIGLVAAVTLSPPTSAPDSEGDPISITSRIHVDEHAAESELQIDVWGVEGPVMEVTFAVGGETHMQARLTQDSEPEVWLSPAMEADLARGDGALVRAYVAALGDPLLHEQVAGMPPDTQGKNPLCGGVRWGLKTLARLTALACCAGSLGVGCVVCALGAWAAEDAASTIDCNKDCNPECPIP